MTNAKAVINLTAGTIELEGPVTFVCEYLERYFPAMNVPTTRKVKAARAKTKKAKIARIKPARVKAARVKVAKEKTIKAKAIIEKPVRQKKIKPLKILTRGKRGRNSLARMVNADIEGGFFDRQVSLRDVDNRLAEKGVGASGAMIKGALKRAIAEGKIEQAGKGRGVVYVKKMKEDVEMAQQERELGAI